MVVVWISDIGPGGVVTRFSVPLGRESDSSGSRWSFVVVKFVASSILRSVLWSLRRLGIAKVLLRMCTAENSKNEGCENESDALSLAPGLLVRVFLLARWHWQDYVRIDWKDRVIGSRKVVNE